MTYTLRSAAKRPKTGVSVRARDPNPSHHFYLLLLHATESISSLADLYSSSLFQHCCRRSIIAGSSSSRCANSPACSRPYQTDKNRVNSVINLSYNIGVLEKKISTYGNRLPLSSRFAHRNGSAEISWPRALGSGQLPWGSSSRVRLRPSVCTGTRWRQCSCSARRHSGPEAPATPLNA